MPKADERLAVAAQAQARIDAGTSGAPVRLPVALRRPTPRVLVLPLVLVLVLAAAQTLRQGWRLDAEVATAALRWARPAARDAASEWAGNAAAAAAVRAKSRAWSAQRGRAETRFLVGRLVRDGWEKGGLGDRLRGLVSLYWAAYQTDRVLLIEWSDPRPLRETLEPAGHDWHYDGPCESSVREWNVFELLWLRLWRVPISAARWQRLLALSRDRPERVLCAYNNFPYFGGGVPEFPSVHPHVLRGIALQALFRPSQELEGAIAAMRAAAGLAPGQPYTAMHFRLGGPNVMDQVIAHEEDARRFHSCATSLRPGLPLLLFSDTMQGRASMRSFEPAPAAVEGGTVFHIDRTKGAPEAEERRGNLVTFASFFLLSRASCLVISNSGLSVLALLMGLNTTTGSRCWAYSCDECAPADDAHFVIDTLANPRGRRPVNMYDESAQDPPPASGACE
jgi:hypothetical protein